MPDLRDLELGLKQLGRRLVDIERIGANKRITELEGALGVQFSHGPETFDLEPTLTDDLIFILPGSPTSLFLDLRGRAMRSGLVGAHAHTGSVASTDIGTKSSGNQSASHTHTGSTGNDGGHSHTTPNHQHSVEVGGATSAPFKVTTTAGAGTLVSTLIQVAAPTTDAAPTHAHGYTTGNQSVSHSHDTAIGSHDHTPTINSAGSGGATANSRPAGVTVTIDGIDRTVALGGPWGAAGLDWNVAGLNILQYLADPLVGSHSLVFGCTGIGRLKAHVRGTVG